jgi:hypothetical protein
MSEKGKLMLYYFKNMSSVLIINLPVTIKKTIAAQKTADSVTPNPSVKGDTLTEDLWFSFAMAPVLR